MAPPKPALTDAEKQRIADLVIAAAEQIAADEGAAADADSLAGVIYHAWVSTYEATLAAEATSAGAPAGIVRLADPEVLGRIQTQAEATAQGIFQTFARDVVRFVDRLPADTSPAEVPRLIAAWNLRRDVYKVTQIAITETAKAAGAAQKDFIARSGASGTANFGYSLQCPICQGTAAGNPYDLDDPTVGTIPHPQCLDSWRIHYDSIEEAWRGGPG